ncbi:MAG: sigma-70 family RNA polymerase sigma factor [Cyclobacteriaceae bacterium]|nr:sigma-70 family RNA polymerase sigma factor [Cyclobacteriaceae bacterium]
MKLKSYIQPIDNPVNIQTEEALISAAQDNPKAFKKLYERYYGAIFGFVFKRINDKDSTADITQQVFLNALTNIKKYKHKGVPFSAYLYRIAINECNGFFRKMNNTRYLVVDEECKNSLIDELIPSDDHDVKMNQLIELLKKLDVKEIQLLELRFFENHPFKEVGYILNISENLAKVKTYRLLSKMKKMLGR